MWSWPSRSRRAARGSRPEYLRSCHRREKWCIGTTEYRIYTTAIVVIPPQESWAAIQAIRQQHDRKVRRWMPHITLIYPFCPVEDFPAMRDPLAAALARLPAFDVTLTDFKTFPPSTRELHGLAPSRATGTAGRTPRGPVTGVSGGTMFTLWKPVPAAPERRAGSGEGQHEPSCQGASSGVEANDLQSRPCELYLATRSTG